MWCVCAFRPRPDSGGNRQGENAMADLFDSGKSVDPLARLLKAPVDNEPLSGRTWRYACDPLRPLWWGLRGNLARRRVRSPICGASWPGAGLREYQAPTQSPRVAHPTASEWAKPAMPGKVSGQYRKGARPLVGDCGQHPRPNHPHGNRTPWPHMAKR